jgi:cell division protein FtsB
MIYPLTVLFVLLMIYQGFLAHIFIWGRNKGRMVDQLQNDVKKMQAKIDDLKREVEELKRKQFSQQHERSTMVNSCITASPQDAGLGSPANQ